MIEHRAMDDLRPSPSSREGKCWRAPSYSVTFYQSDQGWHQATSNALQFFGFGSLLISGRAEPVVSETCFQKNKKVYTSKPRETDVRQLATALYQCYADAGAAEFAKARILSIMINNFTPNQIARDDFLAIRAEN